MIEVCAEIGQTAEGSIERSIEAVNAFAAAGATAVKFQWWASPDNLVVRDAGRYWHTNDAASQHAAFSNAGMIPLADWGPVIAAAHDAGVEFWTTPFDMESVDAAVGYGLTTLKVASGDVTNHMLLRAIAEARPERVLLSTGGAVRSEIEDALDWLSPHGERGNVVLLACSLEYPTPPERASLGRIATLRERFMSGCGGWGCPKHSAVIGVGYSDHTVESSTACLAVAAGATVLEKHVTLGGDPDKVADHAMGLTPAGFANYVWSAEIGASMTSDGLLNAHEGERAAVQGARRGLYASTAIEEGDELTTENVVALRPAPTTEVHAAAWEWEFLRGKSSDRAYRPGEPINSKGHQT